MDVDGKYLAKRHQQLKNARSTLDTHCQEIAQLVLPMMAMFQQQGYTQQQGEKRTQKLMESTAPLALTRYASAVEGFLTPRGERWSVLTTNNKALNQSQRVKVFFDEANDILFNLRHDPRSGFATHMHGCMIGVGAFGTTGMFINGNIRHGQTGNLSAGTTYTGIPLVNLYVSQGSNGQVDTVHREWRHTARNCIADFGDECPKEIREAAEKDPDIEFTIVHVVMPNPTRIIGAPGPRGMAYASFYLWLDKAIIISRGGYRTLRYAIARGPSAPGEHYGRSAAMTVLAEIKTINEMRRSLLRAQHLSLNPPTLIHNEMGANFDMRPGRPNAGMVTQDGKPLAIPFMSGATFNPTEKEMERIRSVINDAFLITLFQILIERPQQTATETLQRAKEQAVLLSPLIGRLQSEFLGQTIESEMDILADYGALPEMPPELIEAQGEYQITYKSDMMRALETGELMAYRNWLGDVTPMAEVNPELLEVVDHEGMAREAAERRGIPSRFIRTDEQLQKIRERKAAEKAQMQAPGMMEQLGGLEQQRAVTENIKRRAAA
jgi:head-to-tail connecting protein